MTNSMGAMDDTYNIYEAKTNLSELVERAAAGEEIIIAKAGVPKVRLVPVGQPKTLREPGGSEGKIWYAPDWDAPMTEEELGLWYGPDPDDPLTK
jgi:prevent-host-death family protein